MNASDVSVDRSDPQLPAVVMWGEFDQSHLTKMRAAFNQALALNTTLVAADLSEVSFLDSAAIAVLMLAHRQLVARGGRLVVTRESPMARRVLEMTGLSVLFVAADPAVEQSGDSTIS